MKRIGIITDVHGDIDSLTDAYTLLKTKFKVDEIVCCGDIIDYGVCHEEVIAFLIAKKITTIRGNHDRWAVTKDVEGIIVDDSTWDLSARALKFLGSLPFSHYITYNNIITTFYHGSPKSDMDGIYRNDAITIIGDKRVEMCGNNTDVLVVGHTHKPFAVLTPINKKLICNAGSLIRKENSTDKFIYSSGSFGVLTLPDKEFKVYRSQDCSEVDIGSLVF